MPLTPGTSKQVRERNIKEMIASGHPPEQAVAAGYAEQKKSRKTKKGKNK